MTQRVLLGLAAALLSTTALAAQPAPPAAPRPPAAPSVPGTAVPLYQAPIDAQTMREQLQEILRQYPPAVGEVLRRDNSLLNRPDYLAPYPQLVAFIQQHPEVVRNPTYFFGNYDYYERREPLSPEMETLDGMLTGMAVFLGIGMFLGVVGWLMRAVIQHRKWLRQSKVQTEVHLKLMDRLTNNDELLAYVQSPVGQRFLDSAPMPHESESPRLGAPVGPIIWSVMAGIVLATVGGGFRLAARSVTDDAQRAFSVIGVILLALGIGFMLASLMAYLVSARLGLFPKPATTPDVSSGNA
jgi:heme/copper-type cytochrome/quinol oxidase subunit 3